MDYINWYIIIITGLALSSRKYSLKDGKYLHIHLHTGKYADRVPEFRLTGRCSNTELSGYLCFLGHTLSSFPFRNISSIAVTVKLAESAYLPSRREIAYALSVTSPLLLSSDTKSAFTLSRLCWCFSDLLIFPLPIVLASPYPSKGRRLLAELE